MLLFSIILRLQLDFERRLKGKLDDGLWFQFSRQDVEFFILTLRATLDHACGFIVASAPSSQWVRKSRFEDLRAKCRGDRGIAILGEDWVNLVRACDWFDNLRTWRVSLVHEGAFTITFFDADTIPFQINQGFARKIDVPEIMHNELVVDFTRFAALYLSYLLCLLDEMTRIGARYLDIDALPNARIHSGGGVSVFRVWSDRLLAMRESPDSPQATT